MKLTQQDVINIRKSTETQLELAERYGVSQGTISNVQNKRGPYSQETIEFEPSLTQPSLSLEDVCEGYGAIDLDDIDLNQDEPDKLTDTQMAFLDDLVKSENGIIDRTPKNKKTGAEVIDFNYVRHREDPNGHKWVLTEEGKLRHALDYYRLEHGLVDLVTIHVEVPENEEEQKKPKSIHSHPPSFDIVITPNQVERVVVCLEKITEKLCK